MKQLLLRTTVEYIDSRSIIESPQAYFIIALFVADSDVIGPLFVLRNASLKGLKNRRNTDLSCDSASDSSGLTEHGTSPRHC